MDFDLQFNEVLVRIAKYPTLYSPYLGHSVFRRAKLPDFPYLIIYRLIPGGARITVVKHEKRHPSYGMKRR
jgi:hypothetical protein